MSSTSEMRRRFDEWLAGSGSGDLFGTPSVPPSQCIPAKWKSSAFLVFCHGGGSSPALEAWIHRLQTTGTAFLADPADPVLRKFQDAVKAMGRDIHKAHAFVRFRSTQRDGQEWMIAWHRPRFRSLDSFVGLFTRRFPRSRWSVFTPAEAAHWDGEQLSFGPGCAQEEFRAEDSWDEVWRTYFRSIFNPQRLKVKAMTSEMPKHHWATLPEARLIPELVREARSHGAQVKSRETVAPLRSLDELPKALSSCRQCNLAGTCRPTPSAGNRSADLVLVGEQPGDEEEKRGAPFVGPAGQVLRDTAQKIDLNLGDTYLTNAVKHFRYQWRGERRFHQRPNAEQVAACRPWLNEEFRLLSPKVVVCLGATAIQSVTGKVAPIHRVRGQSLPTSHPFQVIATYHPAAILRAGDLRKRVALLGSLREDLKRAHRLAQTLKQSTPA